MAAMSDAFVLVLSEADVDVVHVGRLRLIGHHALHRLSGDGLGPHGRRFLLGERRLEPGDLRVLRVLLFLLGEGGSEPGDLRVLIVDTGLGDLSFRRHLERIACAGSISVPSRDFPRIDRVTSIKRIFYGATSFDQDLGWCVDDNVDVDRSFFETACESTSCGVKIGDCTSRSRARDLTKPTSKSDKKPSESPKEESTAEPTPTYSSDASTESDDNAPTTPAPTAAGESDGAYTLGATSLAAAMVLAFA